MAAFGSRQDVAHREPGMPPATARGARGDGEDVVDGRSDIASSTDHIGEKAAGPRLTKRQKVRRHCGRFWLWYLIASIIFLAILLPILFKFIIPAIIQAIVGGQGLPITDGRLDCVSGTQMKLAINTSINTPLPARMTELPLWLYNKDTKPFSPWARLNITGQRLKGDTKIVVKDQLVTISNQSEFVNWVSHIFDEENVDLSFRGNTAVFLGKIEANTHLDKSVQLPGLRKLSGLSIEDLKVMLPPDRNGNNIKGTVKIPNYGLLVMNFGNMTFNILSGDLKIGQITLYNVLLNKGNTTVGFDGQVYLDTVIKNIGPVLASQSNALNRGQVDLNVTGNQVVMNGEHITYIEQLLGSRRLTTSISVVKLLSDVLSGFMGGGGGSSIVDAVGDIFGNNTFIQNVVDHWNTTKAGGSSTKNGKNGSILAKRNEAKEALMWNMLKMGLRMKLNQR
ncbi:uncharacterized protein MAM_08227 [Metarhizium album ARSEF 1941]|uniref:Uncharacterized protein n=1 Tax=Metarhizium album (strain ARSEF 1941) TaxID=1081103 RepID=A0A0B2WLM4_METAS|nr:uncharacterized protein MAM_08227 [Metarhizium album ARSEF 1941]KHN93920.1 hypothetical protein MAM_08227 [Metarhizium album ARSEF 1941]